MRTELRDWLRFVRAQSHVLQIKPWLTWQQAANQPDSSLPAQVARARFELGRPTQQPWLDWQTKPQALSPLLNTIEAHVGSVSECAFSRTDRIISAGYDGSVTVWNAITGSRIASLAQFPAGLVVLALAPDGRKIVAGSSNGSMKVWEAEKNGELVEFPESNAAIVGCQFTPSGRELVVALKNGTIRTHSSETGATTSKLRLDVNDIEHCLVAPGAARVLCVSGDSGLLFNTETGDLVATLNGYGTIVCAAFSVDGAGLVTATNEERLVIWNTETGELVSNFIRHMSFMIYAEVVEPQYFSSCAFSSDGRLILTGSQRGAIKLWNAKTGEHVAEFLNTSTSAISNCRFSEDGLQIVTGSLDGSLRLWDAKAARSSAGTSEVISEEVTFLSTSPDGAFFLAAISLLANYSTTSTIRIIDIQSGTAVRSTIAISRVTCCGFRAPREVLFLCDTGELYMWSTEQQEYPKSLETRLQSYSVAAMSNDASHLITGTREGQLFLWSHNGRQIGETKRGLAAVSACAFSPDGKMILSGREDGSLELRSLELSKPTLFQLVLPVPIISCTFSEDQTHVGVVLADRSCCILSLAQPIRTTILESAFPCRTFAFSANGEYAVSGSPDGWVRIHILDTSDVVAECELGVEITAVLWGKNNMSVAAGTSRGEVHVFQISNSKNAQLGA